MAEATLAAVGDLIFAGAFADDPAAAARKIEPDLKRLLKADILVANLECTLDDRFRQGKKFLSLRGTAKTIDALKDMAVDVVSLANNHALDAGEAGLQRTIELLDSAGIAHFGAGLNFEQASKPVVLERNGLRVGFVGFGGSSIATSSKAGGVPFSSEAAIDIVRRSRKECDFLVACCHEGMEAFCYPFKSTMAYCHAAVDAGADLVFGSHPHTIQGIENYSRGVIAYSLSHFIMPVLPKVMPEYYDYWRKHADLARLDLEIRDELLLKALVLQCRLKTGSAIEASAAPVVIGEDGIPRLPRGAQAAREQAFLDSLNDAFNHPDADVWDERNRMETAFRRLRRQDISWTHVLTNLHRLRWRHVAAFLRLLGKG